MYAAARVVRYLYRINRQSQDTRLLHDCRRIRMRI